MSDEFILGYCKCGCKEQIEIRAKRGFLKTWKQGHNNRGQRNYFWKQGKFINSQGYNMIYAPNDPFKNANNNILEHRDVYQKYYNCILLPYTIIDHINQNRLDNRIENLRPMYQGKHTRHHNLNRIYKKKSI